MAVVKCASSQDSLLARKLREAEKQLTDLFALRAIQAKESVFKVFPRSDVVRLVACRKPQC